MKLADFLQLLDDRKIPYRLDRARDSVMIHVATPGSRWEVEFMDSGSVEIERFDSDGSIYDETSLPVLLAEFD